MRYRFCCSLILTVLSTHGILAHAQNFRRGGVEFNAMRPVQVPAGTPPTVVVTEFFHHGEVSDDGRNVVVSARGDKLVPVRVLQVGPGDFCRIAFQPSAGQNDYEILYSGDVPKSGALSPEWSAKEGLFLQTRHWKDCDLNSFESIRKAFESAKPIGGDYVDNVNHGGNPFSMKTEPFLTKYEGWLHIASAGKYGFLSASQDASFLLVDGKVVVSAPGKHGPMRNAQRGSRSDIDLKAGVHKFEYYHAAAGKDAIMAAAWEVNPPDVKPAPVAIPNETFRAKSVGRAPAGPVTLRATKLSPDFLIKIDGDVPLPDNEQPLVKVSFKDTSSKSVSLGAKMLWEFGDGQTSDKPSAEHVYLKPGIYAVRLSFKRGTAKPAEITNRIFVDRPRLLIREKDKEKADLPTLDAYLPILQTYDAKALDAGCMRQLVAAYETKAEELRAKYDEKIAAEKAAAEAEPEKPAPKGPRKIPVSKKPPDDTLLTEAQQWIQRAVDAGKMAFVPDATAKGDDDLVRLAQLVAPMARNQVGDSKLAFNIWKGASQRITVGEMKAECEIDAAEVAINDLLDDKAAKEFLDSAQKKLGTKRAGTSGAKLQRVWGDYYAAVGDGKAARKAYLEAEQILASQKRFIEQTAWRGAYSRSAEDFIKSGQLDRAAGELQAWQREFPGEKLDGYLTLLTMQYWAARDRFPQALAHAERLRVASPDSAYIDQVLLLAAECDLKRGSKEGAMASLHRLVKDYPGSPLVNDAKQLIAKIESGEIGDPKRPPRK